MTSPLLHSSIASCCHQVGHISFCKKVFSLPILSHFCFARTKTCESNIHHSGDDTAKLLTVPTLFIIIKMTKIPSLAMNVKIFAAMEKVTPALQKHKCHYSTSSFIWEILMIESSSWYRNTLDVQASAIGGALAQEALKTSWRVIHTGDSKVPVRTCIFHGELIYGYNMARLFEGR